MRSVAAGSRLGRPGDGPGILLAAAALAVASNFAFHGVTSHALGPTAYGGFASIMALLVVAGVPVAAVQTAVTQAAAERPERTALPLLGASAFWGAALVLGGAVLAAPADALFRLDDALGLALVGSWAGAAVVGAVTKGVLLGQQRFRAVALAVVAGAGTRIALGSLLTPTVGAVGAMVATLVGEAISTVTAAAFLGRHTVRLQGPRLGLRPRDTWVAFVAQLGLWALAASAVLLGRRVLPSATAGDFAATATLASAAFFLPMAVAVAYFPRFATRPDQAVLRRALRLAALLGGGTAAVLAVAPATSVRALGGPSFRTDHLVAVLLASGAAALGCAGVATYFLLAARRLCALAVWGGIGLCLGGLLTSSPRALAGVVAAGTIGTATTVVGAALRVRRDTLSPRSLPLPAPVAVPSPVPVPVHLVPAPTCAVSVVVPSFNGGGALRPTVLGILRTLDGIPGGSEVIVVIDGSTDGSEQTLRDLDDRVVVERLPENRGKGAAVRHGAERARGTLVGFLDGDGDIEPEVLGRLVAVLGEPGTWAAIGSKRVEGADVRTSVGRRVLSAAYRLLVLTLFDFAVSDTQCGAKLFRREALLATLPWACEEGFALDVELLALGRRFDLGAIVEVPVRLARPEAAPSSVSARAVVRTLRDTFRIWSRLQDAPATVCDTGWGAEAALAAMAQRAPRRKELACAS